MKKIILLNKKPGQTPLDAILEFRGRSSPPKADQSLAGDFRNIKLGYAGRLDPMAEGLLLVMVGQECKRREYYQKMDKEYEGEVLFGISTDTYDVLGIIEHIYSENLLIDSKKLGKALHSFLGTSLQKYPLYSAYRINGEPLFKLAREGRMNRNIIPDRQIKIHSISATGSRTIDSGELLGTVVGRIRSVKGNFRQNEILKSWRTNLQRVKTGKFPIIRMRISCSSGTYIRTLASDLGKKMELPAMLYTLKRTRIGDFYLFQ